MRSRQLGKALFIAILFPLSASQVWAACLNPPISVETINQFKANPQALVAPNSDAHTIEAMTRDLAGSDASIAADLIRVAKGTTPRFQTAIAAGLAQAAIACSTVDQQAAQFIQQAVASFQDGEFQASFAAVAGDLSTAATAAATASATSSVGSVTITNPNTSPKSGTSFSGGGFNAPFQITFAGFTLNPTPVLPTVNSSSTTAGDPVSPSR
jgi:hypothetical protein